MNICAPFIHRPVMTTLLMLGLLVFGILSYFQLPINAIPDVDFPTIVVNASLPGANPHVMAATIATPLEQQFATIAGVSSMTSSNTLGQTQITLQFYLDRNIDAAAQDVQSAISAVTRHLPQNMPSPPTYKKVNPSDAPILYLALSSPTMPLSDIDKYAETILAQRISMVSGVAQVNIYGSQKYAVRVQLNPDVLAGYQLSLQDIANSLDNNNQLLSAGALNGTRQTMSIVNTNAQMQDATAFRPLIVAYRNGAPIRLSQLGDIKDDVQNRFTASWYNDHRAIILAVQRQPGTNTVGVIDGIQKLLPVFKAQLPAAIQLDTVYDRSISIRASIRDVQFTLIVAAILVVIVIFLFLRNVSATVIPSVVLPLSLIGTFSVMDAAHFSLNNISLLALTLVVGYVIDDAIVMLENISRHREMGESPMEAALKGSQEIGFTILSMTLSLSAVFIPVLFMPGLLGRIFHEFAVTSIAAILLSGVISLTLTPMLASRFLKENGHAKASHFFLRLQDHYRQNLQWVLQHQAKIFGVFLFTLLFSGCLLAWVPKGFLPSEDTGQIMAFTEADPDVSFSEMVKRQQAADKIIQENPDVAGVVSAVGSGGASSTSNMGRFFIRLKPLNERHHSADEIIQTLRPLLATVPGISVYLQNISVIPVGGHTTKSTYQYTLQDSDEKELSLWTDKFQQALSNLAPLQDVTSDLQNVAPQLSVNIDRQKAAALGIDSNTVQNILGYAYGGQQVSTIYTPLDDYEVILELLPAFQNNATALEKLYIPISTGQQVPLSTIATIEKTAAPLTVNHQMQFPSATISFNLKPGFSLSDAVSAIHQATASSNPPLTLISGLQGTAQAFQASQKGMGILILLAILVIYIILGILYESFIHPLTILSGLPAAIMGALVALIICHNELNLYSFIGIIMLIGIVKKNAIMMIDFAIEIQQTEKKTPQEAIYAACLIRFRPIMMTTMAAILGALPIALAMGEGSESRQPLGIAVVGGLLLSQFLTLYITPVIYLYLERFSSAGDKKIRQQ